jgi:hypothetical protein
MSRPDFDARANTAVTVLVEMEAFSLDKILERANKAIADKEWPTAHVLFQAISLKAIRMAEHTLRQEVNLMKEADNGKDQED